METSLYGNRAQAKLATWQNSIGFESSQLLMAIFCQTRDSYFYSPRKVAMIISNLISL